MREINQLVRITRYCGYGTVFVEWLGITICFLLYPVNLSEPFSQYGVYGDTKVIFGLTFTIAAVLYFLFSLNLDRYWKYTSRLSFIGAVCFIITGWSPYTPYARTFLLDIHNVALVVAIACYSFPMLFISYTKAHETIAKISRVLFLLMLIAVILSLLGRFTDNLIIVAQLAMLAVSHTWVIMVSYLHLQHHHATLLSSKSESL